MRKRALIYRIIFLFIGIFSAEVLHAWGNLDFIYSLHTKMTKFAIAELNDPEVNSNRSALESGSCLEVHEFPLVPWFTHYRGFNFENRRSRVYQGNNWGCAHPEAMWYDALAAYREGNKNLAYYTLGVLLHQIQDQGVPAHAHHVIHGFFDADNFEIISFFNFVPDTTNINKVDPLYPEPWQYYQFAIDWTLEDVPVYKSRFDFETSWNKASPEIKDLVRKREGRSCIATLWALKQAVKAFKSSK